MPAPDPFETNQAHSTAEQATAWFAKVHSGECSAGERRAFESWLAGPPSNRREYEQLEAMWKEFDQLQPHFAPVSRHPSQTPFFRPALLATAAVLLAVGGVVWHRMHDATSVTTYHTAKGEQRTIVLPDASKIAMNTDTRLTVTVSAEARRLVLENGEILIDVAHDETRPFEVLAGDGIIRDIGTRFDVSREQGRFSVAVFDGEVQVTLANQANSNLASVILSQGQQVSYAESQGLSTTGRAEEETIAAWRDAKLVFDHTPLSEAVHQINRYRPGKVVIRAPELGKLEVSGIFKTDNLDALLAALEDVLPVRIQRMGQDAAIFPNEEPIPPAAS